MNGKSLNHYVTMGRTMNDRSKYLPVIVVKKTLSGE